MQYLQILPVKEWHTNDVLGESPGIPDLPITRYQGRGGPCVASSYRVTFLQRLRFLFSNGQITLSIAAVNHPPLAVGLGDMFVRAE